MSDIESTQNKSTSEKTRLAAIIIGALIVLLLGANLFTRGGSTNGNSKVVFTPVSTTVAPLSPVAELVNQAVLLVRSGQYDTALSVLDKAIATDPNYGLIYYNQGVARQFTNKIAEAVDSYTKALTFNNADSNSYYNRGLALRDLGKLAEAEADLRVAVSLDAKWAAAKFNLGNVLVSLGKKSEGEKLIADAKTLDSSLGK